MLQPESKNDPGMRSRSCFEAADGTRKPFVERCGTYSCDFLRLCMSLYVFVPENAFTLELCSTHGATRCWPKVKSRGEKCCTEHSAE